jgi:hypothetical protein
MQLPTQQQMHLPDPMVLGGLDAQTILMNSGDALSQSSIAASIAVVSDAMPPITFQQDANGTIVPKIEPGHHNQSLSGIDIQPGGA